MSEPQDASPDHSSDDATIGFAADGRVLSVSASAADALGYSRPEDLQGVSLSALIGDEAAITLLDRMAASEHHDISLESAGTDLFGEMLPVDQDGAVTFVRQDGARVSLNAVLTPETSGGWITLLDPAAGGTASSGALSGSDLQPDIAGVLRKLATQSLHLDGADEIASLFARELSSALGVKWVTVARSSAISGIYDALVTGTQIGASSPGETIDLPPSLAPRHGTGPVSVESLETLALFEPVIVCGEEISGAYLAARADLTDGAHVLLIANDAGGRSWTDSETLLLEAGAHALARTLHGAELNQLVASHSRASETVRQIGLLASRDHDGGFLDAARRVIARRLPVSAISIHAADPVTARCYVAAATSSPESAGDHEYGALAPAFEWQLAGSLEQQVLKTATPVFISPTSPDRVTVPPVTIAHWRAAGLQAVAAIPLREAGEVMAVMLAGFSSPVSEPAEATRLLESVTPAVHLGVGLSSGRPGLIPGSEDSTADPGFISPKILLALTRAAAESPDTATLFASVTEWLLEVIPGARVAWGTMDLQTSTYHRIYNYDTKSAAHADEETRQVDDELLSKLDVTGLGLPEPGHQKSTEGSMRAAVTADQRLLGVVTVWPRDDEQFVIGDLARLERICEFISGPLDRILETEAALDGQRKREMASRIGAQAAEFHEPGQALRSLRPKIRKLIDHDRALFVEIDHFDGVAVVRYDSGALPDGADSLVIPLTQLPSPELIDAEEPASIALTENWPLSASKLHPIFTGFRSLLSIPVRAGDGPEGALLLLSEEADAALDSQMELAAVLSGQLKGAQAGWQAYRSTRESTRDLREIRRQLNLMLESAPVALITTDPNGVCIRLEGHGLETLGIKQEDMRGRSIFELTGKLPELEDAIRQALRGVPASALTALGSHSAEIWAQPVTETDGTVKGVTLVGYDVSDRVRRVRAQADKRELQATLRERSGIVGTVSHEMRNQLQSIIAYADVLSVGTDGQLSKSKSQALSVIQSTASKLDRMISDLLGLDYELDVSEIDVSNLMREIFEAQERIFTSAGQTLTLSLPETAYTVPADHLRLTQVVTNLLSNASKYSPRDASVSIEVTVVEHSLNISVIDTGPGIPADQLERVWDSGIRLTSSTNRTVQGSGLGLSIARKIVEMHGGVATIESEEGIGTSVTVTLPGASALGQKSDVEAAKSGTSKAKADRDSGASSKPKSVAGQQTRRRRRSGT